jgi:hypothetical protein
MKKQQKTLTDFIDYKKIYKLIKPKSPNIVEFLTDDLPDEWLITVISYKRKSEIISNDFMILRKDMNFKLNQYLEEGWILTQI